MQNKPSEERLAKGAYNWLRVSPLFTIPTLFFSAMLIGDSMGLYGYCAPFTLSCWGYHKPDLIGIILSALWHLILIQYINNKNSEFVRRHGKQALIYAGVRTVIAFFGYIASILFHDGISINEDISSATIFILIILWVAQPHFGLEKIKKERFI